MSKQVMFKDDKLNGYYYKYRIDGQPEELTYYINGDPNGRMLQFDCEGKVSRSFEYDLDDLKSITTHDSLGKVISVSQIPAGNATVKLLGMGVRKPVLTSYTYKYGHLDGEILDYHGEGLLYRSTSYRHGARNGWRRVYDLDGKIKESSFYRNGERDSLYTSWLFGDKVSEQWYEDGELHGLAKWYYPDGKVETAGNYDMGDRVGYFLYYAPDGQLRFRLNYRAGVVVSYSFLGPDSAFVPEIPFVNGSGNVKAYFKNGKLSADFSFKNGFYDGEYTLYFTNGNTAFKTGYKNTMTQGKTLEYYPNGKQMTEEFYVNDEIDGEAVYYYPDGKRRMSAEMKLGKFHGWVVMYDTNGKIRSKLHLYNDDIIE
jgi:antitoxin component YwqK of YwqJK toxin-antitoxin module